jgi:hypothetical protein
MKKLPIFIFIWLVLACNPDAEQIYTGNELRYNLYAGSNGRNVKFEEFKQLNGHIKIHLADSGPDYQVILTAGNIGKNDNTSAAFSPSSITICASGY